MTQWLINNKLFPLRGKSKDKNKIPLTYKKQYAIFRVYLMVY